MRVFMILNDCWKFSPALLLVNLIVAMFGLFGNFELLRETEVAV